MKSFFKLARTVAVFGQLGFALITPPVLMALFGWWLNARFSLGVWVIAVLLLLGLVTAGATARRLWKKLQSSMAGKAEAEETKERSAIYFRHE